MPSEEDFPDNFLTAAGNINSIYFDPNEQLELNVLKANLKNRTTQ